MEVFRALRDAACLSLVIFLTAISTARGDVARLSGGGVVDASTAHSDADSAHIEFQLPGGGTLVLAKQQVERVASTQSTYEDYLQQVQGFEDSAPRQWELAMWCREQGLSHQFELHAQRVLEIEPDFVEARLALGHQNRNGRWITQNEIMREKGYVRFQGDWMTLQQAALETARQKQKDRIVEWRKRLDRWRDRLGKPTTTEPDFDLDQLDDPDAVPGLINLLGKETNRKLRLAYIHTLGRIGSPQAMRFLMEHSVYQNHAELREECLAQVVLRKDPGMVNFYAPFLAHYDNNFVNRAAWAMAQLEYPSSIVPLATALRTQHLARHSSSYTYFYSQLNFGQNFDVEGPKSSYRQLTLAQYLSRGKDPFDTVWLENLGVRQALIHLCGGQDFGYNAQSYKNWYRQSYAPPTPTIRLSRDR